MCNSYCVDCFFLIKSNCIRLKHLLSIAIKTVFPTSSIYLWPFSRFQLVDWHHGSWSAEDPVATEKPAEEPEEIAISRSKESCPKGACVHLHSVQDADV